MTLHDFLEEVCRHIKYRSIHNDIRDELASHIYEIKERDGFTTEQAVASCVRLRSGKSGYAASIK